ncbi:hypothetical protein [Nocardia rhamnosiphila]
MLIAAGHQVDDDTVRKLMRELDLVPRQPKPWRPATTAADIDHRIPDLVARDFIATAPGGKFVSDIIYIRTEQGLLYSAYDRDRLLHENGGLLVDGRPLPDPVDRPRTRRDRDPHRYSTASELPQRAANRVGRHVGFRRRWCRACSGRPDAFGCRIVGDGVFPFGVGLGLAVYQR